MQRSRSVDFSWPTIHKFLSLVHETHHKLIQTSFPALFPVVLPSFIAPHRCKCYSPCLGNASIHSHPEQGAPSPIPPCGSKGLGLYPLSAVLAIWQYCFSLYVFLLPDCAVFDTGSMWFLAWQAFFSPLELHWNSCMNLESTKFPQIKKQADESIQWICCFKIRNNTCDFTVINTPSKSSSELKNIGRGKIRFTTWKTENAQM